MTVSCLFSFVSRHFRKSTNSFTHNKDALKSIICVWKSPMLIHSKGDECKFSLLSGLVEKENTEPNSENAEIYCKIETLNRACMDQFQRC